LPITELDSAIPPSGAIPLAVSQIPALSSARSGPTVQFETLRLEPFGVSVAALMPDEAVSCVIGWAREPARGRYVCLANVHTLVETTRHKCVSTALRRADLVLPDGMPLVWQISGRRAHATRIAGMDFLPALCRAAEETRVPVFFLGATDETLRAVRERLEREHPRLIVAGMRAPSFGRPRLSERQDILGQIRASKARLVFVALGCPKQELWMYRYQDSLGAVCVGVGGAIDVFAGLRRRAPRTMQRLGLEWIVRLAQEPARLWRRYLETNTIYAWTLVRHRLGIRAG